MKRAKANDLPCPITSQSARAHRCSPAGGWGNVAETKAQETVWIKPSTAKQAEPERGEETLFASRHARAGAGCVLFHCFNTCTCVQRLPPKTYHYHTSWIWCSHGLEHFKAYQSDDFLERNYAAKLLRTKPNISHSHVKKEKPHLKREQNCS